MWYQWIFFGYQMGIRKPRGANTSRLPQMFRIMTLPSLAAGIIFGTFTVIYNRTHPEGNRSSGAHELYEVREDDPRLRATISVLITAAVICGLYFIYRLLAV